MSTRLPRAASKTAPSKAASAKKGATAGKAASPGTLPGKDKRAGAKKAGSTKRAMGQKPAAVRPAAASQASPANPVAADPASAVSASATNLIDAGLKALSQARSRLTEGQDRVVQTLIDPFGIRKLEEVFDQRVASALERLGVPGANDYTRLLDRLDEFDQRLRQLEAGLARK